MVKVNIHSAALAPLQRVPLATGKGLRVTVSLTVDTLSGAVTVADMAGIAPAFGIHDESGTFAALAAAVLEARFESMNATAPFVAVSPATL